MSLQDYINENGLNAEIISIDAPTSTVEESAKALGCYPENIVKSIVVKDKMGQFYLVILQGDRKIKTSKLKKILLVKDVKLASPEEVEANTGYKVGDVPPISVELSVIMDELVLNQNRVYAGGGAPQKNLLISIDELLDSTNPLIADISIPV
ncbi:MAG: aminoacyl-tRNA deacylase [Candidatus Hodarchaeales archaeon]|jgi:prolyl-tRNA editing enzyme YbaK/EbsC (Cys-tRNA(Pro) deacylase)